MTQKMVMAFMAASLVFGVFAPDAPAGYAVWLKDAATAFAGLAALFMHPPTMQGVVGMLTPAKPSALAPAGNPPTGIKEEKTT